MSTGHHRGALTPLPHVKSTGGPTPEELANTPWRTRASCRGLDSRAWFVVHPVKVVRSAQLVCTTCPVRRNCLAWALTFGETYGTWGGLTAKDRKPLAKRLQTGTTLGTVLDVVLGADTRAQVA